MIKFILLLPVLVTIVLGHSNIGLPLAYSKHSCKGDRSYCDKPCPQTFYEARNSPQNPAATWKRGQRVSIIWHKNNHIGGFYRRSLVPVDHMYDWNWHNKTAFEWGCWGQGTFKCGQSPVCGADQHGRAYRNEITVPGVFPDGSYVFGQIWYGGLHWQGQKPKYSDYYACSYIRIEGGNLKANHEPKFRPNPNPEKRAPNLGKFDKDVCATGSTRIRECGGEACEHKKVRYTVPDEFAGGRRPESISSSLFGIQVNSDDDELDSNKNMPPDDEEVKIVNTTEEPETSIEPGISHEGSTEQPISTVHVIVADQDIAKLKDGDQAKISSHDGETIRFEVLIKNGTSVDSVKLTEPPSIQSVQREYKYVFFWDSPPRNEWVPVTFESDDHQFKIRLFFNNPVSKSNEVDCCPDNIPPKPEGAWDATYSEKWWINRNRMVVRREYCAKCNFTCD